MRDAIGNKVIVGDKVIYAIGGVLNDGVVVALNIGKGTLQVKHKQGSGAEKGTVSEGRASEVVVKS